MRKLPFVLLTLVLLAEPSWSQTQHAIDLSWVASPSSTVVKYNVYRSTTTGAGYAVIANTAAPTVTYADTTGIGGTTYYYVVTALDSGGDESVDSNQASATFLANPAPPTGLAAAAK